MLGGHKIFYGLSGDDIMQLSSAIVWVEGQPGILDYGSTKHSKVILLLQHFLFSNQMPETLRSDFPLGPVIISLEQNGSRAGVWQEEILGLRECTVAARWSSVPPQIMQK